MTDLRPEREGRSYEPHGPEQPYAPQDPYGPPDLLGQPDAFEAAVGRLSDPLNDPLPGQDAPPPGTGRRRRHAAPPADEGPSSPWFRPHQQPQPPAPPRPDPATPQSYGPDPAAYGQAYGPRTRSGGRGPAPAAPEPIPGPQTVAPPPAAPVPAPAPAAPAAMPRRDDETMALRQAEKARPAGRDAVSRETDAVSRETGAGVSRETTAAASGSAAEETPVPGGRAARRKAAQEAARRGGRRGRHSGAAPAAAATASESARPLSRVEARKAARAAKDSPSLIASRALGEAFITLGVLMLLFVTYQLWWTNVRAEEEAGGAATNLEHEWNKGGAEKKNLAVGERFGIMYIPKLDVKAPIAEGTDKHSVLDHGMIGHYDKSSGIKTAMPWDKKGNFAVAAHRNTHGEPFRYINRLVKGDKVIVETKAAYYTYEMESVLPQTSPSNTSVITPVPPGSGFTKPGRYITLTTCTPEFTSTFRLIVWGKMVDERPRSKGKPEALGG
ncbi:class E sortase [Streptomyces sp. NRRL S-337]|uniref:class E sortase n=1 Tax=Streptomyces sp. NRRL S-337 TaxID=1463900 RepID=UPI0004C6510B|nr:class E sortase [Streptomyces sp. NRRL S-337]